ncbi:DUF4126 domain-containing protein [Sphingomonas sp. MA1305]|uniref:DUF4126 domain-containing protein n=1 Tax=Sphingomonas sp. MA1305 TaxID=2479204 RepID=UPI0018DFB0C1|nr:DUF4126 domain-containing protein [Sphingomonas sp. MA1305]MBI0475049.1 DUF4126 domain-containing protein [Sphingomonas sp. MA1305]
MLRSFLIGLVAGQRAMTPLAAVATAAQRDTLPADAPGRALLRGPLGTSGAIVAAASEMAGDKMKTAPDRTVPAGLIGRTLTAAYAGAAFAPKHQRAAAAALAAVTAIGASYAGIALRKAAMKRWGQTATGFVEDALVMGGGLAIASMRR